GAELERDAQVGRAIPQVPQLGWRHRLDGRVVADLEDAGAERPRLRKHLGQARLPPEERVRAQPDRHAIACASSRTASTPAGSWANRPRNSPSALSPMLVSRPGPALPP